MKKLLPVIAASLLASVVASGSSFAQSGPGTGAEGTGSGAAAGASGGAAPGMNAEGTGQAGAGGNATGAAANATGNGTVGTMGGLSADQQTQLKAVFDADKKAKPLDVNTDVKVGAAVPSTVTLSPLPARVGDMMPDYKDYKYFRTSEGRIVVVEPGSMKVIDVM